MVIRHRKDSLCLKQEGGIVYEGSNPVVVEAKNILISDACFVEKNTGESMITGADGKTYTYSYVIHLPITDIALHRGDKISITKADGSIKDLVLDVKDYFVYPNISKSMVWA